MQITPEVLQQLNRNLNFDFQRGFQGRTQIWQRRATRAPSTTLDGVYAWLAELPEMKKWIGARTIRNLIGRAYTLRNEPWELTIGVDARHIKFDQIGQYSERFRLTGESAAGWYDKVVTDAQVANGLGFDGQNFYDTDHPVNMDDTSLGTYQNAYTTKPLTVDNFWEMVAIMMGFKGENGVPLEVMPTILETGPKLAKKAVEVLRSALYAQAVKNVAGAENVAAAAIDNPIPAMVNVVPIINPRLAGVQDEFWYLHSTNRLMPFVMQIATDPTSMVTMFNPSDPNVFFNREFVWGLDADGAAGYTLPFLSIRCKETA